MLSTALPWAAAAALLWLLYRLARGFLAPSPLDAIPGPAPKSALAGTMADLADRNAWPLLDKLTNDYGQVVKCAGPLGGRMLWVFDPKAMHHIVVKDQDVYEEPAAAIAIGKLLIGPGLMATTGEHHRRQRKLLNPVFSIAHMRRLTPVFYEVANRLRAGIETQLGAAPADVDLLNWMGRAALELIGTGAFGHSFDRLVENVPHPFADAIKDFVPASAALGPLMALIPLCTPLLDYARARPALAALLARLAARAPHAGVQRMRRVLATLGATAHEIYSQKQAALDGEDAEERMRVLEGRDLMSVLLRENMHADAQDRLPAEEIMAQITTFVSAGTDTTSNALARVLHLLCVHRDAQERLRDEILEARAQNGGDLGYDEVVALPYLDAVCRETLRLYPPASFVVREATKDASLPLSTPLPLADGSTTSALPVPKGTTLLVGIYSANRAPRWGADAHLWRPERWLEGLPEAVRGAGVPGVYSHLMTFNGGARACIGFKFAQLEMKVVLATLVGAFRFACAEGEEGEVVWNATGIAYPTVGQGERARLPLRVERV
ncbi:cytochrome P450 [Phanerochaete sordida]|uniref:Cytochrome P450 n=1 Tax=Phanerochaete sordida TaxID=48140 RepID=A0A9P3GN04_9APHY|nr:cytochrome P450 [Phanerochaete sordida]